MDTLVSLFHARRHVARLNHAGAGKHACAISLGPWCLENVIKDPNQ